MNARDLAEDVATLRIPPHSIEAESSVLGCLLLDASAWPQVRGTLTAADFYRYEHRLIFEAMSKLLESGSGADVITVFAELERAGRSDEVGGIVYLNALAQYVPSAARVDQYVGIVRERAAWRQAVAVGDRIASAAFAGAPMAHIAQEGIRGLERLADGAPAVSTPLPPFLSCAEFISHYEAPDPVLDAIAATGRGRVVAVTGRTHHGKTTILTLAQVCIAQGFPFAGRPTLRGRVLAFCGENPDDFRLHLLATLLHLGADPQAVRDIVVVPGRFHIGECTAEAERRVAAMDGDGVRAVFVDTSASYFQGDSDLDNVAMYAHASDLRGLTRLPGRPLVVAACHPKLGVQRDGLVPRGGGAFLNEIDANLTVWKPEGSDTCELHWHEKLRAPSFDPITFEFRPVRLPERFNDRLGHPVYSVAAELVGVSRVEQLEDEQEASNVAVLRALVAKPDASQADIARALGWFMNSGDPYKMRVRRAQDILRARKLVGENNEPTPAGRNFVKARP